MQEPLPTQSETCKHSSFNTNNEMFHAIFYFVDLTSGNPKVCQNHSTQYTRLIAEMVVNATRLHCNSPAASGISKWISI